MTRSGDARFNRVLVFCRQCPTKPLTSLPSSTSSSFINSTTSTSALCISALDAEARCLTLQRENYPPRTYTFDGVYGPSISQIDIFNNIALPSINDVLSGFNATIMAYGQTGTGKSYTMIGPELAGLMDNNNTTPINTPTDIDSSLINNTLSADNAGILPRTVLTIFDKVQSDSLHDYTIQIAFVQIYCEAIYDLLSSPEYYMSNNGNGLPIREDPDTGIYIDGTTWVPITDAEQCLRVVAIGSKNRAVASTLLNAHSSRSHAIFMMRIEKKTKAKPQSSTSSNDTSVLPTRIQRGTLFLVDLAGSERVSKSGVTGIHLDETRAINLSLTSLGNVIAALAARGDAYSKRLGSTSSTNTDTTTSTNVRNQIMRQIHVPYRDSKLTRLLQDSLGGNARTSLIVTFSPLVQSAIETQSTLEFGARASRVAVHAIRNETVDYRSLYLALRKQMESSNTTGQNNTENSKSSLSTTHNYLLEDTASQAHIKQLQDTIQSLTQEIRELRAQQTNINPSTSNIGNNSNSTHGLPPPTTIVPSSSTVMIEKQLQEITKLKGDLNLQQDYDHSQDELLVSMTEQRKLRERLREVERTSTTRISSLLEELEELRNYHDDLIKRLEISDNECELLRSRLREIMKQNIDHSSNNNTSNSNQTINIDNQHTLPNEAMEAVAEVTKLYEDTLARMTKRVLNLEARTTTTDTVLQEVAYRLRVQERHSAALSQLLYDNELIDEEENNHNIDNNTANIPNENYITSFIPPGKIRPGVSSTLQRPASEGTIPRSQSIPITLVTPPTNNNLTNRPPTTTISINTPLMTQPPTTKVVRGTGPTLQPTSLYNNNNRPSTSMGINNNPVSLSSSSLSASIASANAAALGLPRATIPKPGNTINNNNNNTSNSLKLNITSLRKG